MPPSRIALLQSSGRPGDTVKNLEILAGAAREAAAGGAGLLVCPEMFLTGYAIGADVARLAEPADGPSAGAVSRIAAEHGIAVLYGYPERSGDGDARSDGAGDGAPVHNSARLVGPDGSPLADYRKTHLFGGFERRSSPRETPRWSRPTSAVCGSGS